MLLGREGVGKTTLLKELQNEAKNIFGESLITIYLEYSDPDQQLTPFDKLLKTLGLGISIPEDDDSLERILGKLKETNKYVFLVLDEIQNLYFDCKNGRSIIGEISAIGASLEGRLFCIITGSSYHLRQLCFGKLDAANKEIYPNYTGIDLNSTKYSAKWIYPFLESSDFEKTLKFLYNTCGQKLDQNDEHQKAFNVRMYLYTGGNPRLMEEFNDQGKCDSYSISLRDISTNPEDIKYKIINTIYRCTNSFVNKEYVSTPEELSNEISAFQEWTKQISYRMFLENLENESGHNIVRLIYDLADSGYIRFIQNQDIISSCVSLASPMIYLQLSSKKTTITLDEAAALKSPTGKPNEKIAENVTLRCLALRAECFIKSGVENFKLLDTDVEKIILRYNYENISQKELNLNLKVDQIINRFFKETFENDKDVFGMDGLLLERDSSTDNGLIAHRIQIKLGTSSLDEEEALKIISKVNSHKRNFEACFTAANKTVTNHFNYLVTTRGFEKNALECFNKSDWIVVDKKNLKQIWPENVKALGKPFN